VDIATAASNGAAGSRVIRLMTPPIASDP